MATRRKRMPGYSGWESIPSSNRPVNLPADIAGRFTTPDEMAF